jgi:ribosomal protein S18 acetylase RimI-like enzyme
VTVKVRPGLLFDVDVIAGLQVQMALETENLKLDLPTVTMGVSAVFDDPAKGKYWVAEIGDEFAGCLLTVPEWSDWRNGTVLWIHSVYVLPQFRSQGVYRALYKHLKTMVSESRDLRGLRLYVEKTNVAAQKVYRALGMDGEHYQLFEWMK